MRLLEAAVINHRGRPDRRSYSELQTVAAAKEITMDALLGAVLSELDGIFALK